MGPYTSASCYNLLDFRFSMSGPTFGQTLTSQSTACSSISLELKCSVRTTRIHDSPSLELNTSRPPVLAWTLSTDSIHATIAKAETKYPSSGAITNNSTGNIHIGRAFRAALENGVLYSETFREKCLRRESHLSQRLQNCTELFHR